MTTIPPNDLGWVLDIRELVDPQNHKKDFGRLTFHQAPDSAAPPDDYRFGSV